MIVIIDNYDSFVYNLYGCFRMLGEKVLVFRNDRVTLDELEAVEMSHLVLSPGPCTPDDAGICVDAVRRFCGRVPILGVCLGHQAIARAFGGLVDHAQRPMHGKASKIYHDGGPIYRGLPNPLVAARYHSLVVVRESLPSQLVISALDSAGEIMGLRHRDYVVEGVQFHPESILTPAGLLLLANFVAMKRGRWHDCSSSC
ncbi:MAG: anthranilate synthase component II [Bacillota bacterium]